MNTFCLFLLSPLSVSLLFKFPLPALVSSPMSSVTYLGKAGSHCNPALIFLFSSSFPHPSLSPLCITISLLRSDTSSEDWKCQYLLLSREGKTLELPLRGRLQNKEVGPSGERGEQQSHLSWLNRNSLL